MEKLQAAIEKARAQRQAALPAARAEAAVEETSPGGASELWAQLTPIEIEPGIARKNRLVSLDGGLEAGPFDMLRTRILQQARANNWKRIALVSPHKACGKTTTVANVAFSFSRQSDLRTLVLDLDLRRPGLAKMLGHTSRHGMADVLQGKVAFGDHGCRYGENVAFGLSKGPVQNASEILQSHKTREILDQLETDYTPDIMLFDMPPLMATDDNYGFLKNADCVLLLVEAERTTTDQVDVAERQIAELTNVMGIILNKAHYMSDTYGYGYGYG